MKIKDLIELLKALGDEQTIDEYSIKLGNGTEISKGVVAPDKCLACPRPVVDWVPYRPYRPSYPEPRTWHGPKTESKQPSFSAEPVTLGKPDAQGPAKNLKTPAPEMEKVVHR